MLNRVRQPFNVNSIALAAALAALDDSEHLQRSVETNRAGMAQLRAGFDALGVRHLPSAGNFVMIDCGRPAAAGLRSDAAAGRDRAACRQLRAAQSPAHHDRNARAERAHAGRAPTSADVQGDPSMTSYSPSRPQRCRHRPRPGRQVDFASRAHARRHRRGRHRSPRLSRKRRLPGDHARDARARRADRADDAREIRVRGVGMPVSRRRRMRSTWATPAPRCA